MAKVLLVEDDNNLREIYEARLQAEGYDITSAQDGEQALVVAKTEKPDLIISDVMMPKISGFEMLDILRNTEGLKDTKVIMLTALGQAEDRGRADSLGADRYLVKSQVTLEDIVKAAHELLEDQPAATTEVATPAAPTPTAPEPAPAVVAPVAAAPVSAPTPEIAVSTPPVEPAPEPAPIETPVVEVAPEPADVVEAPEVEPAPEPAVASTTAPATDDTAASDDAVQVTTSTDTSSTSQDDATEETVGPELTIPGLPGSVENAGETPATELPSEPAEPVEPAAPDVPASAATEEATPNPAATSDSTTEAPTTAEEQATMESQIEDFIHNSPTETPATTPAPQLTNDEIMQESVDSLIASAEETNAPLTTEEKPDEPAPAPEAAPAPAPEAAPAPVPAADPAPQATPADTSDDGVTIAHKKVLQPINDLTSGPDLNELLSREEAKHIADGTAPAAAGPAITSDNPVTPSDDAQTPATDTPTVKTTPGHTIIPTTTENSIPPTKKDDFDPNNISL